MPFDEARLDRRDPLAKLADVGGVYVASPNNPTGTVLDPERLRRLADACARRGVALAIDACFRIFDPKAHFDHYSLLDASGADYVVVEDTGKLWPLAGVRLAFLAFAAQSQLGIPEASADLLMMAPPFNALVVEAFAHDAAAGGMRALHEHIGRNRAILREALQGCDRAELADGDSKVTMSLIRLAPGLRSTRLWGRLLRRGVNAVPGRPIWWARPGAGERFLRVALGREPEVLQRAAREIRSEIDAM